MLGHGRTIPVPRRLRECYDSHMPQGFSRRVVAVDDDGSNPFELGIATEPFGLHPRYDFRLRAAHPAVTMHGGLFTMSGVADLSAADDAATARPATARPATTRPATTRPATTRVASLVDRSARSGARAAGRAASHRAVA